MCHSPGSIQSGADLLDFVVSAATIASLLLHGWLSAHLTRGQQQTCDIENA
ncbi:hypothetical protein [Streptomyces sp. NPDC056468]|uniref:hypothetical protein n=1 Tax=Streptomyces sp. NPDC056468 TaxID=3345830 RepID=UPI0036CC7C41